MPKLDFSKNAKFSISAFKKYRNSIIIYTEDKPEDRLFYLKFFRKLLEGTNVQINDIFPLGSCNVVDERERNDKDLITPKIYVTDGDIYLMHAPRKERKRHYPLPRYCIENYLIDENQICNLGETLDGTKTAEEIQKQLKYKNILEDFAEHIVPIFYYYSLLSEYGSFTIDKYEMFYDSKHHCFLKEKISSRIMEMRKELINRGLSETKIDEKLREREINFPKNIASLKTVVSAKNFTFPYLKECLKHKCKIKSLLKNEALKCDCAQYIDKIALKALKDKIVGLCATK